VVKKRTAKRSHEEVVGQDILSCDVPQRQLRSGVVAHDEAAGITIGGKIVVLAAPDLHLVLVEAVPQIAGRDAEGQIEAFGIVDRKGRIGQMRRLRLRHVRNGALGGQPIPDRRQLAKHRAVAIAL
jgi:hypothetical protein